MIWCAPVLGGVLVQICGAPVRVAREEAPTVVLIAVLLEAVIAVLQEAVIAVREGAQQKQVKTKDGVATVRRLIVGLAQGQTVAPARHLNAISLPQTARIGARENPVPTTAMVVQVKGVGTRKVRIETIVVEGKILQALGAVDATIDHKPGHHPPRDLG